MTKKITLMLSAQGIGSESEQQTAAQHEAHPEAFSLDAAFPKKPINIEVVESDDEFESGYQPTFAGFQGVLSGVNNCSQKEFDKLSPDVAFNNGYYLIKDKQGRYFLAKSDKAIEKSDSGTLFKIVNPRVSERIAEFKSERVISKLSSICMRIIDAGAPELVINTKIFDILDIVKDKENFLDRLELIICNCSNKYDTIEKLFSLDPNDAERKVKNWANVVAYNKLDYISEYYCPDKIEDFREPSSTKEANIFKAAYEPGLGEKTDNLVKHFKDIFDENIDYTKIYLLFQVYGSKSFERSNKKDVDSFVNRLDKYIKTYGIKFIKKINHRFKAKGSSKYMELLSRLYQELLLDPNVLGDISEEQLASLIDWIENYPYSLNKTDQQYCLQHSCFREF